jgi:hypothetical protein
MPEGMNPESSGRRRTIQDHQSWARSSRWSSPDLLIMRLPGYDSYDRRLSFTISERFFACLTTRRRLVCHSDSARLIRICSRPDCSPPGGPTRRARLMGEHDRLYAVAEVELLEDVRDVGLDGGLADVELVPDLRVREAASHQAKDVSFAITELVELLWRSRT